MFLRNELNATCVRLAFGRFTALIDRCRSFVSGPLFLIPALLCALTLRADQKPYFVTYDHELEDVGDLEISLSPIVGLPKSGNAFLGSTTKSSTASETGGQRHFTWMGNPPAMTARCSPASVGKTACGLSGATIGSIRCSTLNTNT